MKRSILGIATLFTTGVFAATLLVACSGDDTNTPAPPGPSDASTDATVGDAGPDTSVGHVDAGSDANLGDSSTNDSGGACTPFDAAALDDAAVQAGLALVEFYKCAGCHQTTPADAGIVLSGNSIHNFVPDAGPVFPPNLTPDPATGLGCWSDQEIRRAILVGIDDQNVPLCIMPRFSTRGLDGGGADEIIAFLRSLPAVVNDVPGSVCPVLPEAGAFDAGDASAEDASGDDAGDAANQ